MAKMQLEDVVLQQEDVEVDGVSYMLTAWPASYALAFIEKNEESLSEGKANYQLMKDVVCSCVTKDNKQITSKSFDIIFSRKTKHLIALYQEVLNYNLGDLFTQPDSEE